MVTKEQLHKSVRGTITPVRITLWYRIALFFVAFGMILLPFIYLIIILSTAYGVFFFAKDPGNILASQKSAITTLLLYGGPLFIGGILLFFMVKPLITKLEKPSLGTTVTRDEEPVLFYFIELICRTVNAPVPKKVLLNCEPNAYASFKNGLFSFFNNDLQLVIGLPLASTMTVTQLGGILAHEFGHFSQGTAMRFTHIIRSMNRWFFRLVFERDKWDERIERWSGNTHFALAIPIYIVRLGIWTTRKILQGLLLIGNMMSSIMLRQMEFDADRHEIRLAGTKTFIATTNDLNIISAHWSTMCNNIFENWSNKKLINNIPAYLKQKVNRNDKNLTNAVKKKVDESATALFDTHPSDKERILNAKKENTAGIFHLDESATTLFQNFEQHSLISSTRFYIGMMGDDFDDEYLTDVESFRAYDTILEENNRALTDFYGEAISVHFPITFKKEALAYPPEKTRRILQKISGFLTKRKEKNLELIEQKYSLLNELSAWQAARLLLKLGFKIKAGQFNLSSGSLREAKVKLAHAADREDKLEAQYKAIRKYVRPLPALLTGADLLSNTERQRLNELVDIEHTFATQYQSFRKMMTTYNKFLILVMNQNRIQNDQEAQEIFKKLETSINKDLKNLHDVFDSIIYPFETKSNLKVSDFLFPEGLDEMGTHKILNTVQTLTNLYTLLYCRVVGEVGALSLKVMDGALKI